MSNEPMSNKVITPANIVTLARIVLIPVFFAFLMSGMMLVAIIMFVVLAATDKLDGYLARSRGEVTVIGAFLDPLADKILICAALLCLMGLNILVAWATLIIIAREFLVSGLRMVAAQRGVVISARPLGKAKTVFQMIAVLLYLLYGYTYLNFNSSLLEYEIGLVANMVMFVAVILTLVSMIDYFYSAYKAFKGTPLRHSGLDPESTQPDTVGHGDGSSGTPGSVAPLEPSPWPTPLCHSDAPLRHSGLDPESTQRAADALDNATHDDVNAATQLVHSAQDAHVFIGTAESCTGGLVAAAITSVAGSSEVFKGSVVSYANEVKHGRLGVKDETLNTVGAVSEDTARQMAVGACNALNVDAAVSTTGIAGPGGGSLDKPVGTVWFGVARRQPGSACHSGTPLRHSVRHGDGSSGTTEPGVPLEPSPWRINSEEGFTVQSELHVFDGDREQVRAQAVDTALRLLLNAIQ